MQYNAGNPNHWISYSKKLFLNTFCKMDIFSTLFSFTPCSLTPHLEYNLFLCFSEKEYWPNKNFCLAVKTVFPSRMKHVVYEEGPESIR